MGDELLFNLIVILAFVFTFSYLVGKLLNSRRKKQIGTVILNILRNRYSKMKFADLGDTCMRLLCTNGRKGLPEKLELTVLLMDRGNLAYYPINLLKRRGDYIILKANLKRGPSLSLEIISLKEGKMVKEISKIPSEVKFGNDLDNRFVARTTELNLAERLLSNHRFRSYLSNMKEDLRRISISRAEPHILIMFNVGKQSFINALNIVSLLNSL